MRRIIEQIRTWWVYWRRRREIARIDRLLASKRKK